MLLYLSCVVVFRSVFESFKLQEKELPHCHCKYLCLPASNVRWAIATIHAKTSQPTNNGQRHGTYLQLSDLVQQRHHCCVLRVSVKKWVLIVKINSIAEFNGSPSSLFHHTYLYVGLPIFVLLLQLVHRVNAHVFESSWISSAKIYNNTTTHNNWSHIDKAPLSCEVWIEICVSILAPTSTQRRRWWSSTWRRW